MENPINKMQNKMMAMTAGVILDLIVASMPDDCPETDCNGERSMIYIFKKKKIKTLYRTNIKIY